MTKQADVISALDDLARNLTATAKRLKKSPPSSITEAAAELGEVDRALLELHHQIVHLLAQESPSPAAGAPASGEIDLDELTRLLYSHINPPESRRNYTYTPPFSIERVLKAYLDWKHGPGKGVQI